MLLPHNRKITVCKSEYPTAIYALKHIKSGKLGWTKSYYALSEIDGESQEITFLVCPAAITPYHSKGVITQDDLNFYQIELFHCAGPPPNNCMFCYGDRPIITIFAPTPLGIVHKMHAIINDGDDEVIGALTYGEYAECQQAVRECARKWLRE